MITFLHFLQVNDWRRNVSVTGEMALEVAYYNEALSVWEPLIEPVEDGNRHRPWEISIKVVYSEVA